MPDDALLSEAAEVAWRGYLSQFRDEVYPMFKEYEVSFETALSVWFINRLRNAIDDTNAGNEPWQEES